MNYMHHQRNLINSIKGGVLIFLFKIIGFSTQKYRENNKTNSIKTDLLLVVLYSPPHVHVCVVYVLCVAVAVVCRNMYIIAAMLEALGNF